MLHNLAVYGTLRKGEGASDMLPPDGFVGPDKIAGKIYQLGWFPGVKLPERVDNPSLVTVDIVEGVTDEQLARCDAYEGYDPDNPEHSLFVRKQIKTESGRDVWVYEYAEAVDLATEIKSGDWLNQGEE